MNTKTSFILHAKCFLQVSFPFQNSEKLSFSFVKDLDNLTL